MSRRRSRTRRRHRPRARVRARVPGGCIGCSVPLLLVVAAAVLAGVGITACSSTLAASTAAAAHAAKPKASPKPACTAPTFDYIERDDDPGASVIADEAGNCDLATGQGTLATFQQEAGQAPGVSRTRLLEPAM